MAFLLDTNVISELVRPRPDEGVVRWTRAQRSLDVSLSVLTLGEIEKGLGIMSRGARHDELVRWLYAELPRQFVGRLLPIDLPVAQRWGQLAAEASASGRPLPVIDGLLLATASVAGFTFVTRNVSDCARRGVPVYDPWLDVLYE
ncbi:MAG: type II toxin-antitoxin system VapC family toxin [bacterium]